MKQTAFTKSMKKLISRYFHLEDFLYCSETWKKSPVPNIPQREETVDAIISLARNILDPLADNFGKVELSYGFAGAILIKTIKARIAPKIDQHAGHEINSRGNRICQRDGFAVDLFVPNVKSLEVAKYIVKELPYDRLYYYGTDSPIHVSYGPEQKSENYIHAFSAMLTKGIFRQIGPL